MSKYDVDFKCLVLSLLPPKLRRPAIGAYCYCIITPICKLYDRFIAYRKDVYFRLYHNGQICYLRALLNDMLDTEQRRIEVYDPDTDPQYTTIYLREMSLPLLLSLRAVSPKIVNRRAVLYKNGYDFWVIAPAIIKAEEKRLVSLVNNYKIASKRWMVDYV